MGLAKPRSYLLDFFLIFVFLILQQMGRFSWFGDQEHNKFNYTPLYYDKEKEELKRRFGAVDGSASKGSDTYVPGSYIKRSMGSDAQTKTRKTSANRAQNIIGVVGLTLLAIVLIFIAKFYMML